MADEQTAADQRAEVDLDAERVVPGGYVENPDHVPNPYFQYGNLETTDLGTTPSKQMETISPVFAAARAQNLETAARALDPNDPTPSSLVVLPESVVTVQGSARTADDAREEIYGELNRLAENPVILGRSPAAEEAALGTAPEDAGSDLSDEEVAADERRAEVKKDAQQAEDDRLAAARDQDTVTSSGAQAPAGAPVAGTSSTPSAKTAEPAPSKTASTTRSPSAKK